MPNINLITKYANHFEKKMRIGSLVFGKGLNKTDFTGVNTVKTLTPVTQTPNDYDLNAEGSRFGALSELEDSVNTYTLQYSKSNNISIDKQYNTEQLLLKRAFAMMKEQIEIEYTPMMDKHALATYCAATGISKSVDGEMTAAKVKAMFSTARKAQVNAKTFDGKSKHMVAWVPSTVYNDCILGLEDFKTLEQVGTKALVDGAVGKLRGYSVIEVPDEYFPEGVNCVFANLKGIMDVMKFKTLRILSEHPDVDGSVLQPHFRYGCFVEGTNAKCVHISLVEAQSE